MLPTNFVSFITKVNFKVAENYTIHSQKIQSILLIVLPIDKVVVCLTCMKISTNPKMWLVTFEYIT